MHSDSLDRDFVRPRVNGLDSRSNRRRATDERVSYRQSDEPRNMRMVHYTPRAPMTPAPVASHYPGVNLGIFENTHVAGGAITTHALTPSQTTSLLSCSNEFRVTFPYIYTALTKGLLDMAMLQCQEIIVPLKHELKAKKELKLNDRIISNYLGGQLQKGINGRFPDVNLAGRLISRVTATLLDHINDGITEADNDRTIIQKMTRSIVNNEVKICQKLSASSGSNAVIVVVEGTLSIEVRRGELFDSINPRKLLLESDLIVKFVYLNGGQLATLDCDGGFQNQVGYGNNRQLKNFILG